jgi:hypothetical protein
MNTIVSKAVINPMTKLTKVSAKHTLVMVIMYCHQLPKPTLGA